MELGTVFTFAVGEPATLEKLADTLTGYGIEGATLIPAAGLWKGKRESSTLIQIAGIGVGRANAIAAALAMDYAQEAVYLEHGGTAYLVSAPRRSLQS